MISSRPKKRSSSLRARDCVKDIVSVCVAGDDGSVSAADDGVYDRAVDGAALASDSRRVSMGGRVTTLIVPCSG